MIYVIGDTQLKPGVRNPLIAVAYHIVELKPKWVVHLGDHHDMPSLSAYDKGKKSHRIHSYLADIKAGNRAFYEFWMIIESGWPKFREECIFHFHKGNHEYRITRALEYCDDSYKEMILEHQPDYINWTHVHEFLHINKIQEIRFCHYFQNLNSDRPIGTARQIAMKKHKSCIAGHKQGFDYEEMLGDEGENIQCMILGSTYYHPEGYKIQSNHHFRGTVVLYNYNGRGEYDFARYSLDFLDKSKTKSVPKLPKKVLPVRPTS